MSFTLLVFRYFDDAIIRIILGQARSNEDFFFFTRWTTIDP